MGLRRSPTAFYMIAPKMFESVMEELADQALHRKVLSRMAEKADAIEVDIDEI